MSITISKYQYCFVLLKFRLFDKKNIAFDQSFPFSLGSTWVAVSGRMVVGFLQCNCWWEGENGNIVFWSLVVSLDTRAKGSSRLPEEVQTIDNGFWILSRRISFSWRFCLCEELVVLVTVEVESKSYWTIRDLGATR